MQVQEEYVSESRNTRLVGFSDLQGRETLQATLRGNWCYVGHHPGTRLNPLTGKNEENGTTILDVSNPQHPTIVSHIPGAPGANCRAVHVVEHFYDGNDYLIRNHELKKSMTFQVFKITDRANPVYVSSITETPAGLLTDVHKGWWDETTGLFFGAAGEPGFRPKDHLIIWDLSNPNKPKYVSNHWLPGQKMTEPDPGPDKLASLHHPIVDMPNKKVYLAHNDGGDVAVVDIGDIAHPKTILHFTLWPLRGPHSAMPFTGVKCPNFTPGFGDVRDFIVVTNEAEDGEYLGRDVRTEVFLFDVTTPENPLIADRFKVPDGDFLQRGGRFGSHQFAETKDGKLYSLKDNNYLLYEAYFCGGLRILDLSDPFNMKEVGYFIPKTTAATVPRRKAVIQTNDVDIDYRGLAYMTDRAGTGLHVVEYVGK